MGQTVLLIISNQGGSRSKTVLISTDPPEINRDTILIVSIYSKISRLSEIGFVSQNLATRRISCERKLNATSVRVSRDSVKRSGRASLKWPGGTRCGRRGGTG